MAGQITFFIFDISGKHEGQVYIQTSEPFNPAHDMAARIGDVGGNAVVQRNLQQITWKPYLTSSPSRTPTVVTKELAVWNPLEYPYGKYFWLFLTQKMAIYHF